MDTVDADTGAGRFIPLTMASTTAVNNSTSGKMSLKAKNWETFVEKSSWNFQQFRASIYIADHLTLNEIHLIRI